MFPRLQPGEAIFLTRFEPGRAIGVQGIARSFTLTSFIDYVDVGEPFSPYRIPTEFRADLDVNMLALRTVVMDIGDDIWTPDTPMTLPQPRLGDGT